MHFEVLFSIISVVLYTIFFVKLILSQEITI